MKFQKPEVEIIRLDNHEIFMYMSSGKICWYYGFIDTLDGHKRACYAVQNDGYNYAEGTQYVMCEAVEGLPAGRVEVTGDPDYHYGATIP